MTEVAISPMGMGALLLDAAGAVFSEPVQARIHAVAARLRARRDIQEVVPGMNNLLVCFDPVGTDPAASERLLRELWSRAEVQNTPTGKTVEIPVTYGGAAATDLQLWAAHCGLTVAEAIRRHAEGRYHVAAVGAMPGFPYLSGLDPSLAIGRRAVPRAVVAEGSVIIGGMQAGIMPTTAPSGWHIIGHTPVRLFDPEAENPSLLAPGDRLRFVIAAILP